MLLPSGTLFSFLYTYTLLNEYLGNIYHHLVFFFYTELEILYLEYNNKKGQSALYFLGSIAGSRYCCRVFCGLYHYKILI